MSMFRMYGNTPAMQLASCNGYVWIEPAGFVPETIDILTWQRLPIVTGEEFTKMKNKMIHGE